MKQLRPLFVEHTEAKRQIADLDAELRRLDGVINDLTDAIAIMARSGGAGVDYFSAKRQETREHRRQVRTQREKLAASLPSWEQSTLRSQCDQHRSYES